MKRVLFLVAFICNTAFAQVNLKQGFVADSYPHRPNISNIINDYTPVIAFNPCENKITVEDATAFNVGDTVLMIQMKGAVIDSTNTAAFGTITDYKNAGNYEFNYVKSKSGNIIELKNYLTKQYDIPTGKVQLVRVPYYQNANVTGTLSCLPWDGSKGGVLAMIVQDTITLNADIDVSGKGFRGAVGFNPQNQVLTCFQNNFNYPIANNAIAGQKGESIMTISQNIICGKGSPAGGGGGGLGHNSGGGGGANGGTGGFGGYQLEPCGMAPFDNRGIGGHSLTTTTNKIYLGSGGGAGQMDNIGTPPMSGGNGGGLIIIISNKLKANSHKILANGNNGTTCVVTGPSNCHDAMGGGGAGGTVLISTNTVLDNTIVEAKGGKGGDMIGSVPIGGRIGSGGGGGGGIFFTNSPALPANITNTNTGGANGVLTTDGNNPWGATAGQNGISLFNLNIPFDLVPFKPNIDSVRIQENNIGCGDMNFIGLGYTNTNPISSWQWYFGDGGTAGSQNTNHTYAALGGYIVKLVVTDINGCKDSTTKNILVTNSLSFDFSYRTNACNPLSVQFDGIGAFTQNPYWIFGDGTTLSGNLQPIHTYPAFGNYTIKYSVGAGICSDTITKTINLSIIPEDIIATRDTTICFGTTKQLIANPGFSICWSPTTYLSNPNISNPVTNTPQAITYYYTAEIPGTNVVTNGNFSSGNTGFTSQYIYANPNTTEGQYFVGPNPQAWNASTGSCPDHTGGNGNMMLVNGAPIADVRVWSQTVPVTPNTNYAFSTWIQAIFGQNPAQLQFSINGSDIGTLITASLPICNWSQFYTTWNSGNNTTALISIVNKNTLVLGNDFALDDISMAPIFLKRDSVIISVDTAVIRTIPDPTICQGNSVSLPATGGISYSWSPAGGLSNPNISNPNASPAATTQYFVTGTNVNGCTGKDTVLVNVNPKPLITKSANISICQNTSTQLSASGGITYNWSPAGTLDNSSIPNPTASPTATTTYYVVVTDANGCSNNDSIKVSIVPPAVFTINAAPDMCLNKSSQLQASGGHTYAWQPASSLNNSSIPNPLAVPPTTTQYDVLITDTICHISSTLSTTVKVLPLPDIQAARSNDIDCSNDQSQLSASGGIQYQWSPGTTLNQTNIPNPIARPLVPTTYTVLGTDATGCQNIDTVTVNIIIANPGAFLMPSAFTPNGDQLNDCYGIRYWGVISGLEFSIYNRWGERLFYTSNPAACWDGKYKGVDQNPDVFVYMIRAKSICSVNPIFRKGTFALIR